jgi:hypothetical protein
MSKLEKVLFWFVIAMSLIAAILDVYVWRP